jgi:eukaryotic-like serine/threonine-protein kinase
LFRSTGEPVLADFGVEMRQAFRRDPLHGIEWVSPETLRTGAADSRTDLYGLGAVLHFALTGESPHPSRIGEMTGERILRVLGDPVPAISRPDVPIGLSTAIGRLLAPDPAKRSVLIKDDVSVESPPPRSSLRWYVVGVAAAAGVAAVLAFWPRSESPPPVMALPTATASTTAGPAIVVNLAEPVDLGDQALLNWTVNADGFQATVVGWPEGERSNVLPYPKPTPAHTIKVRVEPGRKYCFMVRGTNRDQTVESQVVSFRSAVCRE